MSSSEADLKWRHRWQSFPERKWETVRDSWLEHMPTLMNIPSRPEPGLDRLPPLLDLPLDNLPARFPDVEGLRSNTLTEAVYLFHKCSHANLAAQRLAMTGMHSWCLFNAYHSAYLGARGIMAILGVAFADINSHQVAIDLFPAPDKKPKRNSPSLRLEQFQVINFPKMDQRRLWEGFQRIVKMSEAQCWDEALTAEILDLKYEDITRPRNHFLYRAGYWPLDDLLSDLTSSDINTFVISELDCTNHGFLLRLSFVVYFLFEKLIRDLGEYSSPIKAQAEASRCIANTQPTDLMFYSDFKSRMSIQ